MMQFVNICAWCRTNHTGILYSAAVTPHGPAFSVLAGVTGLLVTRDPKCLGHCETPGPKITIEARMT